MEVLASVDPNWIIAGIAAGGTFLGAWRIATHFFANRRERQEEYARLHCDVYGWPAVEDDYGNEVEPPRLGALDRISQLEERTPQEGNGA